MGGSSSAPSDNTMRREPSVESVRTMRLRSPALVRNTMRREPSVESVRTMRFRSLALVRNTMRREPSLVSCGTMPLRLPAPSGAPANTTENGWRPERRSNSLEFLPPEMSELRVVLLGNSWTQRSSVGNFILGETVFNTEEEPDCYKRVTAWVKEKEIVLINTPDLLHPNISLHELTKHIKHCVSLSAPGPHVFLLVLQPEDFTEEHKEKLCRVLQLFSDQSFAHSLVLISTPREESPGFMERYRQHPPLKELISKCHFRFLWQKDLERSELLTRLGQIVKENSGDHVSCGGFEDSRLLMRFMYPTLFAFEHMSERDLPVDLLPPLKPIF